MTNVEIMQRWFDEVWNKQNVDVIDELFAEDGVAGGLANDDGSPVIGPKDYKPFQQRFLSAFPDLKVSLEDTVTEGEKIGIRCRVTGTHCGDGIGVQPCNKAVDFGFIGIARIRDGKITEAWNSIDFLTMYQQLGAVTISPK